ncbi:MAG TPA: DNA polymerase Y family protein, partial [Armatimonadota bacterium]|nr:DNA polymerase Y family protein [Armatimonadota bacterium]
MARGESSYPMYTAAGLAPKVVACLWLPHFAVTVERARRPELPHGPLVLVGPAEASGIPLLRACSPEALAAGLTPGMRAADLSRCCPGAMVLPFDGRCYEREYEALLLDLDAITPHREACPLEEVYLDLSGLPHLNPHDIHGVAAAVRAVIPPPFVPRIGIASGKFTACAASRRATTASPRLITDDERPAFLRDVPSALLPVEGEMLRRLDLLGLKTLGQIARLPRSAMLAQFGRQGEHAHRLARGEDREPLIPYAAPLVVRETLSFPAPADTIAQFHVGLAHLLQRACGRPECRNRGVRQVRLHAQLEPDGSWERTVTLRRASERWDCIYGELKRRLEEIRPQGSLTELSVELTAFAARVDGQGLLLLEERQRRRESLRRELDQLEVRLGDAPVCRVVEVEPWSRLPECQYG